MEEQQSAVPVSPPQAVTLIGWLTIVACAFWLIWGITEVISHFAQLRSQGDFSMLSTLGFSILFLGYFVVRPTVRFLAMRPGSREEMVGVYTLIVILTFLYLLSPAISLVGAFVRLALGTVDPVFQLAGLPVWRLFAALVAIAILTLKIRAALKSRELVDACAAAEAVYGQRRLHAARRKAGME